MQGQKRKKRHLETICVQAITPGILSGYSANLIESNMVIKIAKCLAKHSALRRRSCCRIVINIAIAVPNQIFALSSIAFCPEDFLV